PSRMLVFASPREICTRAFSGQSGPRLDRERAAVRRGKCDPCTNLHLVTGHEVARLQRTYGWNFPPALLADDRTAGMEDAARRRGQGRGYFAAERPRGAAALHL